MAFYRNIFCIVLEKYRLFEQKCCSVSMLSFTFVSVDKAKLHCAPFNYHSEYILLYYVYQDILTNQKSFYEHFLCTGKLREELKYEPSDFLKFSRQTIRIWKQKWLCLMQIGTFHWAVLVVKLPLFSDIEQCADIAVNQKLRRLFLQF